MRGVVANAVVAILRVSVLERRHLPATGRQHRRRVPLLVVVPFARWRRCDFTNRVIFQQQENDGIVTENDENGAVRKRLVPP